MSQLEEMTAFVRAVEASSFSVAARRLCVAKSVVSRRIGALEARLGTSLLHRTTRRLSLTETGAAYYERARRVLLDVAEADEIASSLQSDLRGKLRVAAPVTFGIRHLSSAVAEFLACNPNLEVELNLDDRRVDLVSDGYDLAVRIGRLPDSSLVARTLAPCRHVVCASPAYLRQRGVPETPDDLAGGAHDCLVYSNRPASEQWRFLRDRDWSSQGVKAKRLRVNNGEILRQAAVAGLGLVALPTFIVGDAVLDGSLQVVLRDYPLETPAIHAMWPPNRQPSAKVRAMVEFLAIRFGGTPPWDRDAAPHP